MSDETRYVFHGRVIPERTDVHVSPPVTLQSNFGEMNISISSSQIIVIVYAEHELDNIYTVRNAVQKATYVLTDIFSFTSGYSYSVEITSVVTPDDKRQVFGVGVPVIKQKLSDEDRLSMFESILQIYGANSADYLQRSMHDLQRSMEDPRDTGFFCYRSIETIRKYFQEEFNISGTGDGWRKLREELDIERDKIDEVKEFADEPRHGGTVEISDEERANVFVTTWEVIQSYVKYLENAGEDITPEVA